MFKKIQTTTIGIDEGSVVFDELADLIETNDKLSEFYKQSFVRTEIQQRVKDVYDYAEIPDGETLHILLYGSVGSGKTWAAFSLVTDILVDHPGASGLGVRATYDDLNDAFYKPMTEFFSKFQIKFRSKLKPPTIALMNGSYFRMRSSERTSRSGSDKADELGGTKYSVAVLDEADSISEEFARTVSGRMRDDKGVKRKLIIYICNPPAEDHWLYEWFFEQHDPDDPRSNYRAIHMPISGNRENLPEGYEASVHKDYAHNPALYRRMVEGRFGPAVKGYPVFASSFNPQLHIAAGPIAENWNQKYPLQRCWDFGWRRPACVVFQDDHDTGQIRVFKSWLGSKIDLDGFSNAILQACFEAFPGAEWEEFVDPQGVAHSDTSRYTSVDILRSKGLRVKYKKTSIEYGVSIISEQLGTLIPYKTGSIPSIIFDPSCGLILDSIQYGYCVDKDHKEDAKTPIKIEKDGYYEHLLDAFRYGIIFKRRPNQGRRRDFTQNNDFFPVGKAVHLERGRATVGLPRKNLLAQSPKAGPVNLKRGMGNYNFGRR